VNAQNGDPIRIASDPRAIDEAAELLKKGGLVAFPTETVYGLGADALDAKAVCRIFEVKKRPSFDPLIVHVDSPERALGLWSECPDAAKRLMKKFWPGALTLVLPKSSIVPDVVTSGLPTVAVRMPAHPVASALIQRADRPIAAPSANLFGRTSPTTARAVLEDLGNSVEVILDAGPCRLGIESTILKIEPSGKSVLLRPGATPLEEIQEVLGAPVGKALASTTEAPGMLETHYAPQTKLSILEGTCEEWLEAVARWQGRFPQSTVGVLLFRPAANVSALRSKTTQIAVLSASGDLYESAANLFEAMRKIDRMHLDLIVAGLVPDEGIGRAINDRLRKASGGRTGLGEE